MNNSFNANQINEIINRIETTQSEVVRILSKISNDFSSLSGMVMSEDSGLSGTCNNINNTYRNLSTKLSENLTVIKTALTNYVQQTIQNETQTSQSLNQTNEGLENAKSILDSL